MNNLYYLHAHFVRFTMGRYIFICICVLSFKAADAQKDTLVFYLKNSGKIVSTRDSSDYFLMILPPDTSVDKNLFIVKGYYPNGKIMLMSNSKTNSVNVKLQGSYIAFFPNGHKEVIRSFEDGEPVGDIIEYYPNGKLYTIKSYTKDKKLFLKQCNDSTGIVLAEKGNGTWIKFLDENFTDAYVKGPLVNGLEEGEWHGERNNINFIWIYKKGVVVSSTNSDKTNAAGPVDDKRIFTSVEVVPEFPGGMEAFGRFLARYIHYPAIARENNIQGRVIISFVVERDGTLSGVRVARGIGDGCDEEALRVIKLSPPWNPGMQNGKAVRVAYSVPIAFTLSQ